MIPGIAFATAQGGTGTLQVNKYVVNDNGGTALPGDFDLFIDGTQTATGDVNTLNVGTHQVTETPVSGYYGIFGGDCDASGYVSIDVGDVKFCVLTNNDSRGDSTPSKGVIIVIKEVINDDGGTKVDSNFNMKVTGDNPSLSQFPGSSYGVAVTVDAGSYSIDEDDDSTYTKTLSEECTGTVGVNETKICTITNDDIASGGGGDNDDEIEDAGGGSSGGGGSRKTTTPSEPTPEPSSPDPEPSTPEPTPEPEPAPVVEEPAEEEGEVLGDTACGIYLTEYIHLEKENNTDEVLKLQLFLNDYMNLELDVSGVYDIVTYNAVKDFQVKESKEILEPWGLTEPTGYVYKTTKRRINMIKCPDLNLPMPSPLIADSNVKDGF